MKRLLWCAALSGCMSVAAEEPSLTIYNQNFAVVRQTVPLNLEAGVNRVQFSDTTAHLEPESVILRDPTGKHALRILEQNFRADPVSDSLLLSLYEGQTIDFEVLRQNGKEIVPGRIVRSGYVPHRTAWERYGPEYAMRQQAMAYSPGGGSSQPIIEVDGKLRFSLPGIPLFPALASNTVLKPTLHWVIESPEAGSLNAELSYLTGGMSWDADYNITAPVEGDSLDLVGWVTIDNQSGPRFRKRAAETGGGET